MAAQPGLDRVCAPSAWQPDCAFAPVIFAAAATAAAAVPAKEMETVMETTATTVASNTVANMEINKPKSASNDAKTAQSIKTESLKEAAELKQTGGTVLTATKPTANKIEASNKVLTLTTDSNVSFKCCNYVLTKRI